MAGWCYGSWAGKMMHYGANLSRVSVWNLFSKGMTLYRACMAHCEFDDMLFFCEASHDPVNDTKYLL